MATFDSAKKVQIPKPPKNYWGAAEIRSLISCILVDTANKASRQQQPTLNFRCVFSIGFEESKEFGKAVELYPAAVSTKLRVGGAGPNNDYRANYSKYAR
jgi:hypothetical protein